MGWEAIPGMVCVDFRREFEAAPHQLLVGKVLKDGQKGSWVKNWLNWAQREASVVYSLVGGMRERLGGSWWPAKVSPPQGGKWLGEEVVGMGNLGLRITL